MRSRSDEASASMPRSEWWENCVGKVLLALANRLGPRVDVLDVVSPGCRVRDLVVELGSDSPSLSPSEVRGALEVLAGRGHVSMPLGSAREPIAEVWLTDLGLVAARMIEPEAGRVVQHVTLVTKHNSPMLDLRMETGSAELERALNDAPTRVFVALLVMVDQPSENAPLVPSELAPRVGRLLEAAGRQRPGPSRGERATGDGVAKALQWLEKPMGLVRGHSKFDGRVAQFWLRGSLPEIRISAGDPAHLGDWMNFRIVVQRLSNGLGVEGYVNWERMLWPGRRSRGLASRGKSRR